MSRFFNTTGPCNPRDHYMLPPAERLINAQLSRYIKDKLYWVLHAPRQTGKTTFLQSWMREINSGNQALAAYVSVEICQGITDPESAMPGIVQEIVSAARQQLGPGLIPPIPDVTPVSVLKGTLQQWAAIVAPKPLIVLFDEVDVLQDQSLVSFLRQLRSGFADRGVGLFPVSIALVGMRDLRDYLIRLKDGVALNPGSPFNIKEDSASIGNFSRTDVNKLISQHTEETGQQFEPNAIELIYELTRGQPWLVNSLAKKCVWKIVPEESKAPVTVEHVLKAKEMLIQDRAVHLDSLAERLKEPRVKKIIQPIMTGESEPNLAEGDDFRYCLDLGIVSADNGTPQIANPIYREVIPRTLNQGMQYAIPLPEFKWCRENGTLDMAALLKRFQAFWRRNADLWEQKSNYTEAFPHLLLMAFLQRVTNGGGRVEREYAAGRGRMDLAIEFAGTWTIIEIELVHPSSTRIIEFRTMIPAPAMNPIMEVVEKNAPSR
ncbi:MAG: ATP-binding protein [Candidatus Riflebacteria bacterium]|nr:ATP-binding protein [Candidatus Riflebacteria bacterium]